MLFYALFVCKCVLPPGDNPSAVNISYYIISYHIISTIYVLVNQDNVGLLSVPTPDSADGPKKKSFTQFNLSESLRLNTTIVPYKDPENTSSNLAVTLQNYF